MGTTDSFYDELAAELRQGKTLTFDIPDSMIAEGVRGRFREGIIRRLDSHIHVYTQLRKQTLKISLKPFPSPKGGTFKLPYTTEENS